MQYGSGSLDGQGRIPWQHVGPGTRTADPYPERHARPWEPAELDFTYAPRISRTSAAIMAEARGEGGGGFLDRLDSDLRRRQSKVKVRAACTSACAAKWHACVCGTAGEAGVGSCSRETSLDVFIMHAGAGAALLQQQRLWRRGKGGNCRPGGGISLSEPARLGAPGRQH